MSIILNSKRNTKLTRLKIYLIIKHHNALCWKLKQFNDFWKFVYQFQLTFILSLFWILVYVSTFDTKSPIQSKFAVIIFMLGSTQLLCLKIYTVFIVSNEVS